MLCSMCVWGGVGWGGGEAGLFCSQNLLGDSLETVDLFEEINQNDFHVQIFGFNLNMNLFSILNSLMCVCSFPVLGNVDSSFLALLVLVICQKFCFSSYQY